MAVTALQITVPETQFRQAPAAAAKAGASLAVRRPTNGIVLKDNTFATLQLIAGNGQAVTKLVDAGSRRPNKDEPYTYDGKVATDVYSNFFLQSISESREEKQQIMETFGDPYIFFFGQRARVMQFQGVLLNTWDFNWEAEWWHNYEHFLRGTRCVENDARIYIQYDNVLVGGYILGCQAQKQAEQRNFVSFGFTLFVTDYVNLGNPVLGSPDSRGAEFGSLRKDETVRYTSDRLAELGRPKLLDSGFANPVVTLDAQGNVVSRPLADALAATPSSLADSWRKTIGAVNNVFDRVQQVVNGTVLRVPVGFTGSLAYDEQELTTLRPVVTPSNTIAYSRFQENQEEYVTGDSYPQAGYRMDIDAPEDWFGDILKLVDVAWFFEKQGVSISNETLVSMSRAAQVARLGLISVNLIRSTAALISDQQFGASLGEPPFTERRASSPVEE